MEHKIKKITNILLGISLAVCALSGFFMNARILSFNLKAIHVLFGVLLIILALIHVFQNHP